MKKILLIPIASASRVEDGEYDSALLIDTYNEAVDVDYGATYKYSSAEEDAQNEQLI